MRGNFITDRNGCKNPNYKGGRTNTRLYGIYHNMKTRCYNAKSQFYHRYGGRGITVCEEWKNDFQIFYEWAMYNGYSDELTLDRIDSDKGYSPDNCRWTDKRTQAINRCTTHLITIEGVTKSLIEWCEIFCINYQTVQDRLKRGWSEEKALKSPVQTKFRRKVI
jgi:hypothetical protein